MSDVSDDKLREIIAGTEGVTPGPWVHGYWGGRCRKEHAHRGRNGSDPCVYDYSIVEGANGVAAAAERVEVLGSDDDGLAAKEIDLRYIARLDPATVRSICEELLALRAALERLISERDEARKALEPFAKIKPSTACAEDGSEAEPYRVFLACRDYFDFTGADLAAARRVREGGKADG